MTKLRRRNIGNRRKKGNVKTYGKNLRMSTGHHLRISTINTCAIADVTAPSISTDSEKIIVALKAYRREYLGEELKRYENLKVIID